MKLKLLMLGTALLIFSLAGNAQLRKGNVLIGADIANLDLSLNTGSNFNALLNPKAAWFIQNNLAIGAYGLLNISTAKNAGTSVDYGIGPLARYYFNDSVTNLVRQGRFFLEGNVGIQGSNPAVGNSTNGFGLGVGPGFAYFLTPNVGLEALLKYNLIVGFGSSVTTSDLLLAFGLQIYLPRKTIEAAVPGR